MEHTVFFLHKDQAIEFQNRCVIAIFLDTHPEITFVEYLEPNKFLGSIDSSKCVIYLFSTPKKGSESGYVFRARNRAVSKPMHKYMLFSKQFLDEYVKYRSNVYEYIMEHFFSHWSEYFGGLFISKDPVSGKSFKYKKCVEEIDNEGNKELGQYFKGFLDGSLVFSNPVTFNDPFDCDCELLDLDSWIRLLWNAFNSIKYSGHGSTSVKKEDIEKILKDTDIVKNNIRDIIWSIVDEGKKDDRPDKSKSMKPETIDVIVEACERMLDQVFNLKERFRVFCTADKPDDILMWGYYCDGGNGVCCKYNREKIANAIFSERRECICVYGNVEYQDNKPQYEYITDNLANNVFDYVITRVCHLKGQNGVLMDSVFCSAHTVFLLFTGFGKF